MQVGSSGPSINWGMVALFAFVMAAFTFGGVLADIFVWGVAILLLVAIAAVFLRWALKPFVK